VRESKEARVKYVFACEVRDSRVWRGSSVFRVCVCVGMTRMGRV
jgi:hypothetical protein